MIASTLKVMLWNREVGRLSWDGRRGISYFEFNRDFLQGSLDVFPLVASIRNPASRRPVIGDKETRMFQKLPPFIADSMPDAWGSQVFECWRLEQGIKNQEITPLDVLSFIGKRGMGALEFVPESSGIKESEAVHLQSLTELAHRIFLERENLKIRAEDTLTMRSLIAVGTSAGGRQPKAIIAVNPMTGEIRSGQIPGLKGFEYCMLKFGDADRSSAELEMAYYEMACLAGIEMMPCRLLAVDGKNHFVTRRFDRDNERKLHVQTLAAIWPEADSYEELLMVCRKMRLPESAQEEVFRRMVFNILANNTDDHNKNFSFLMDEDGKWRLSPAYDMTYIFNAGGFLPETMHCLMMRGKLSGQTLEDALSIAGDNGIRKAESIIRQVADAISSFRGIAAKYGVPEKWINPVESTLEEHLASWGLAVAATAPVSLEIGGTLFLNVHVERTYKGNYHLYATVGGRERRYVIGKNKEEYSWIESTGASNLPGDVLREMVRKYLLR